MSKKLIHTDNNITLSNDELYRKKIFIRFLKENNAYQEYMKSYESFKFNNKVNINSFIIQCSQFNRNEIICGFPWGFDNGISWYDLANKWHRLINNSNYD